jgi:hypothetical protein
MFMGVLVVAFPVSVFSDLWSKEVKKLNKHYGIDMGDDDEDNNNYSNARDGSVYYDATTGEASGGGGGETNDRGIDEIYQLTKAKDVEALLSSINIARPSSPPSTAEVAAAVAAVANNNSDPVPGVDPTKPVVIVQKEDLAEIFTQLDTMRESELRIRNILNKYNLQMS